jgi:predicted solute-binding protein
MKVTIKIVVRGGVVFAVLCSETDVDVEVFDFDSAKSKEEDGEDDAVEILEHELDIAESSLEEVY